jgi:hypothetical protein
MSRNKALAACAAAMAVLAWAAPAAARALPDGGLTATEISSWLGAKQYPSQVKPDPTTPGDQIVSTTIDGVDADIYLYDCSGDGNARRCTSMQYVIGASAKPSYTLQKVNEWNRKHRYIRAYLTTEGALYGEYDLDISPGGTYEMLDDSLDNWRRNLSNFTEDFGS